jgi:hypothetical protein
MKMIWPIIGAAFVLPLCAAETQKTEKQILFHDELNKLVWRLVMFDHYKLKLPELKKLCVVNKQMNAEISNFLQPCRTQLKTFVEQKYGADHCEITYSPDRFSAAIVEKTELESTDGGFMDQFIYIYFDNALKMREKNTVYPHNNRVANYPPFFTPQYVCLDFGTSNPNPPPNEVAGLYWNRSKKTSNNASFYIAIEENFLRTGWLIEKLPHLYATIMQKLNYFKICYETYGTKDDKDSPSIGFTFDLADVDILTPKDIAILGNFVPDRKNGEWCIVKRTKSKYLLFNLLACYGNDVDMLNLIDQHVEKQIIKGSGDTADFIVSTCRDIIVYGACAITDRHDPHFSTVGKATLDYVQRLKKEGVFVEKDWNGKKLISLKKRTKKLQQALSFLKHKRMTFIAKDKSLIRHDLLSNTVKVVTYRHMDGGRLNVKTYSVPVNIDLKSLKVAANGQIEYKTI